MVKGKCLGWPDICAVRGEFYCRMAESKKGARGSMRQGGDCPYVENTHGGTSAARAVFIAGWLSGWPSTRDRAGAHWEIEQYVKRRGFERQPYCHRVRCGGAPSSIRSVPRIC